MDVRLSAMALALVGLAGFAADMATLPSNAAAFVAKSGAWKTPKTQHDILMRSAARGLILRSTALCA
jgi:hypothetical protein